MWKFVSGILCVASSFVARCDFHFAGKITLVRSGWLVAPVIRRMGDWGLVGLGCSKLIDWLGCDETAGQRGQTQHTIGTYIYTPVLSCHTRITRTHTSPGLTGILFVPSPTWDVIRTYLPHWTQNSLDFFGSSAGRVRLPFDTRHHPAAFLANYLPT